MDNNELMRALGRIEAKLDTALDTSKDHDKRIGSLEKQKHFERGIAATVGALASLAIALVTSK